MFERIDERALSLVRNLVVVAALLPLARLGWLSWNGGLGANPIEYLSRASGWWTLFGLMLTLGVTPARRITGWSWLVRLRRALGLCTFGYAVLHFIIYLWLDQFFDWAGILKDVVKRPFITVGFAALLLMTPLALTSTNAMVRRLGGRRWQWLHRLVYLIGMLGVTHYWWLVKKDIREPLAFACVLAVVLGLRLWFVARRRVTSLKTSVRSQVA